MQVDVRTETGVVIVEPVGDIDGKTAPAFTQKALSLLEPRVRLVLSLQRVAFMSSAGLRSMLLIYQAANSKKAQVVLAEINENIRRSMSATGFLPFFVVRANVPDAIQTAISFQTAS